MHRTLKWNKPIPGPQHGHMARTIYWVPIVFSCHVLMPLMALPFQASLLEARLCPRTNLPLSVQCHTATMECSFSWWWHGSGREWELE